MGLGRQPDLHRAAVRRAVGPDQERRLVARVGHVASSATGRRGCGTSRSTISSSAGRGAYGIGYGAPAAVGAALANRKHGRLSVNIQCDGDLNYAPGVSVDGGASQAFRCSPSCTTTAPTIRSGCTSPTWRRARTATSAAPTSATRSTTRHRLRDAGQGVRRLRRRADRQPERSRARDQEGDRGREARRAGARRRRDAAALKRGHDDHAHPASVVAAESRQRRRRPRLQPPLPETPRAASGST